MQAQRKKALKMNGLFAFRTGGVGGDGVRRCRVFIPAKLKDGQIDAKSSVATLEELGS